MAFPAASSCILRRLRQYPRRFASRRSFTSELAERHSPVNPSPAIGGGKRRTFRRDLRLYAKEGERASTCPTELATSCRTGVSRRLRRGVHAVSGSCRRAGLTSAATPASSARPVAAATCGLARGSAGDSRSGSKRRENLSVGGVRRTSQSNAPVCVIAERCRTDYRC